MLEETIAPILETETGREMEMVMVVMETVAVEMAVDLYKSAYSAKNDYKIAC